MKDEKTTEYYDETTEKMYGRCEEHGDFDVDSVIGCPKCFSEEQEKYEDIFGGVE